MYVCMHIPQYKHTGISRSVYMYVCMCVYRCIHVYMYVCIHTYTVYMYICIYIYINTDLLMPEA